MFETSGYAFSTFSVLYKYLDRGKFVKFGGGMGHFVIPQPTYLVNVFSLFVESKHPELWKRIKGDRVERFY
jgi:hypothetical protein